MNSYSVKQVSNVSKLSIRTIHYYDKIGLLKPASRTEVGYRLYGEEELLRLQQILFYRELGFPLTEIKALLDDSEFDLMNALKSHKKALKADKKRISTLLDTIDHTIHLVTTGKIMTNPESLYEGLPKEVGTIYRAQAMEEYGNEVVEASEKNLMAMDKEGFQKLQKDFEALNQTLFEHKDQAIESETVQGLIAQHYQYIRQFWGNSHRPENMAEAYAGLGQLYMDDERFTMIDKQPQPEFARFLQQAMTHYAETKLGNG